MKALRNLDNGIQMGEMSINNIRYADDTTLVDLVFDKLQINGIGEGGGVEVGVALILNILIVYAWNHCLTICFLLVLYWKYS